MRVLVLGYGSMGRRHARHAKELGHEVHIFDPLGRAEVGEAAPIDATWHATERAAKRSKPDAIVIAAPASAHGALLAEWDGMGVPVLCEKPLALSRADYWAARLQSGVQAVPIHVAYNLRFQPHIRQMVEAIESLDGPPESWQAVAWLDCNMAEWPGQTYADSLLECSHEIDLAAYLLGHPMCYGAVSHSAGRSWELQLICGKTPTTVHINTEAEYARWFSITSAQQQLWWAWHVPSSTSIFRTTQTGEERLVIHPDDVYRDELRQFLDHELGRFCQLKDALAVLGVCDRARQYASQQTFVG